MPFAQKNLISKALSEEKNIKSSKSYKHKDIHHSTYDYKKKDKKDKKTEVFISKIQLSKF